MAISKPLSIIIVVTIPIALIIVASFIVIQKLDEHKNNAKGRKDKHVEVARKPTNPENNQKFNNMMIDVYSMISMATNIFPVDTTLAGKEKSLSDIKDIGIYYWDRNLEVLDSLKKINDDQEIQDRLSGYQEYCKLSKTCYQLMYKAVDEHTQKYNKEIDRQLVVMAEKYDEIIGKE